MASGAIKEVFAEFGIKVDDAQLEAMSRVVGRAEHAIRSLTPFIEDVEAETDRFGRAALGTARETDKLADALDDTSREARKADRGLDNVGREAVDAKGDVHGLVGEVADLIGKFAALAAGGAAIRALFVTGREASLTARRLGLTAEQVAFLSTVAAESGAELDDVRDVITTYGERVRDAILEPTSDAATQLEQLGIAIPASVEDMPDSITLLNQVSEALAGIEEPSERAAAANTLLGDVGARLLPSLQGGAEGLQEMALRTKALGGGLSQSTLDQMEAFNGLLGDLSTVSKSLADRVLKNFGLSVNDIRDRLFSAAPELLEFVEHSAALKGAITALTLAFGAFAAQALISWLIALGPVILVTAAIAGVGAAIADVFSGMKGGESVIGDFIDQLLGVGTSAKVFNVLRENWQAFSDTWSATFSNISNAFDEFDRWAQQTEGVAEAVEFLTAALRVLASVVGSVVETNLQQQLDAALAVPRLINEVAGQGGAPRFEIPRAPAEIPGSPTNVSSRSSTISQNSAFTINIDAAMSPQDITRQIERVTRSAIEQANRNVVEDIEEAADV